MCSERRGCPRWTHPRYEGADIVHDLNRPLPQSLHGSFDVVLDGGLLEHVFNFPMALKNSMEMVKVGGHLLLIAPANNNFGHGFYQFSPELFFRALSAENGFTIERMLAIENDAEFARLLGVRYVSELKGRWYKVTDAAQLGERVTLINRRPVMLFSRARRTECAPVFAEYPQQSEWIAAWGANPQQAPGATDRFRPYSDRTGPRARPTRPLASEIPSAGRHRAPDQSVSFVSRVSRTNVPQPCLFSGVGRSANRRADKPRMIADLIYDVGMNNGDDTAYYLFKGYRVVAVEADPTLIEKARERFADDIRRGQLELVNVAVGPKEETASFWICDSRSEWNSFNRRIASREELPHHAIDVQCRPFRSLLEQFGVPSYLKIDIEGHDHYCVADLDPRDLPKYISLEMDWDPSSPCETSATTVSS